MLMFKIIKGICQEISIIYRRLIEPFSDQLICCKLRRNHQIPIILNSRSLANLQSIVNGIQCH